MCERLCHNCEPSNSTQEYNLDVNPSLPIFKDYKYIKYYINHFETFIIISDTGSGKSTQVPKIARRCVNRLVCCVQPRRIAATSLAGHVSKETNSKLGDIVGYKVRFDEKTSNWTRIVYMTEGILLRESIRSAALTDYGVVILDEVHERSLQMDALLGVVKAAQSRRRGTRNPLKVVLMSATMEVDIFSRYFGGCHVLACAGREFPLRIFHLTTENNDSYVDLCVATVVRLHSEKSAREGILVFLTGQEEIDSAVRLLRRMLASDSTACVLPLYGALPLEVQSQVFGAVPPNVRKIVVSTNIAETSVTISGISHVVDSGRVKTKEYDPGRMVEVMRVGRVSRAQAVQRAGRAAREGPGCCHRVYSEGDYLGMDKHTLAEIHRTRICDVLLLLLASKVKDIEDFDFIERPSRESIADSMEELRMLGAVEGGELTSLGRRVIGFPIDVRLARILVEAQGLGCTVEMAGIVSMMTVDTFFYIPHDKREKANRVIRKFVDPHSDHITALNVFRGYKSSKQKKEWCRANFVNLSNLQMAASIRAQIKDLLRTAGGDLVSCGNDREVLSHCLIPGLVRNIAELKGDDVYQTVAQRQKVHIHPGSVLYRSCPPFVVFQEIVKSNERCYIRQVTAVKREWVDKYFVNK